MCRLAQYERKLEPFFTVTPWIAEFFNTISNLPFILIGLFRLYEGVEFTWFLYAFMILIGICSGVHHATTPKWTIVIDWVPIVISMGTFCYFDMWPLVSYTSLLQWNIALLLLFVDHFWTIMPVPWGHVCWHLVAALAMDSIYFGVEYSQLLRMCEIPPVS